MKKASLLTGLIAVSTAAVAAPWQMVGPRVMGMGGAGETKICPRLPRLHSN